MILDADPNSMGCVILTHINTNFSVDQLADTLVKRGGHINKYYLQEWNRNKKAIVYLKTWFGGKNIREALLKALV